jgi:uncharacterized protein
VTFPMQTEFRLICYGGWVQSATAVLRAMRSKRHKPKLCSTIEYAVGAAYFIDVRETTQGSSAIERVAMFRHWKATMAVALIVLAMPVPGTAQDYEAGLRAYGAGNYQTAFETWRPIAEQGNADAQFNLGTMFEDGKGVAQDFSKAVHWYRRAAQQGDAPSQFNLGSMYAAGMGVMQDFVTAHMWYSISEANGEHSGRSGRVLLEAGMTNTDVKGATRRARDCLSSSYRNCE